MLPLDFARAAAKRLLSDSPLRPLAKRVWTRIKLRADRRRFLARYPDAAYVVFDAAQLARARARGSSSQYGQDVYLWDNHLSAMEPGYFVDIGANMPVAGSNSLWLERHGWQGMAFDPMRALAGAWAASRQTPLVNAALGDRPGPRPFIEIQPREGWEHALSGFKGCVRDEDLRAYDSIEYDVPCGDLASFLPPGTVPDIAMIDVEGAEAMVIAGIDFARCPIRFILCENAREIGGSHDLRGLIESKGYRLVARIGATDDLFVRRGDAS